MMPPEIRAAFYLASAAAFTAGVGVGILIASLWWHP